MRQRGLLGRDLVGLIRDSRGEDSAHLDVVVAVVRKSMCIHACAVTHRVLIISRIDPSELYLNTTSYKTTELF